MVQLATQVVHYKHGKKEKKIQDVSPGRLPPLGFSITFYSPDDV